MAVIEVNQLVKKFRELTAVDQVSFDVEEGEIFGFLGPNGAGKTTTINILCTLLKPTAGRARVNGYDVIRQPELVRRSIGLVFQEPSLDEQLTAQENLDFHATLYDVPGSAKAGRIEEALKMVELYDRRNHLVRDFSGGMKRRLELARGLIHYPKVLFLDEPTLGLDPQTRSRIWEYILHLREREGITIFLTTHYMDEAENAHRIGVIDYGRIVALDTPERLKDLVGGDIITLRTANDEMAAREIEERFGLSVNGRQDEQEGLWLEVPKGEEFIPLLVSKLETPIVAVSLRRPTLDDVFLKLTGRQIREEKMSQRDRLRTRFARGPRMRGH